MKSSVGLKLGFWLASMATLSTGLIGYYVHDHSQQMMVDSSKQQLLTSTRVLAHRFNDALSGIAADVKLIESLPVCRQILDPSTSADANRDYKRQLAETFTSLLASRPEYSQIRLIDARHFGKELVRADRDQQGIQIVPPAQLQEKNHFAYVFETTRLAPGKLYISEINLNQELGTHLGFGQPTIRIASPIADRNGLVVGVAVINVNLDDLFVRLRANLPNEIQILLANSNGDYLIHPDPHKTFAFERGQQFLIQRDLPATWPILKGEQEQGVFRADATDLAEAPLLAAFVRLSPGNIANEQPTLMIGLYSSLDQVLNDSAQLGRNILQATTLIAVIAVILSLLLARILSKPLNLMTKAIGDFELGKPLADLPNQRNDEIGYLANSFAKLAIKLNHQIAELHDSEAKLQTILENLPLGIWLTGKHSRFLNKTFREALAIDDRDFFDTPRFAGLLDFDRATDHVTLVRLPFQDGREHLLEIHKVALSEQQDDAMIGIAIDITERKQAEEILRSSEEKLRSMFQMSPLGITQNAMDGRFIETNKAFLDIVGYSLDELNTINYWKLTPPEYQLQEQLQFQALAETGKYGPYEKEYIHRDGRRVPVRLNGMLITDSDGKQYIWSIVDDITQRKQSEQLIWRQANFDPLTGLPNRRMFHDRLEQELKKAHRTGQSLALIFLDLDRFKEINDTMGHDMGDLLLQDTARRLSGCVRESDTVARLGGDEFTLILGELDDLSSVERIVQNILRKLAEPFQLQDKPAYVSGSVGVTIYPKDGGDSDTLIKNADQAMYAAKHQGRNRYSYFTASMHDAALARMQTASDLRVAVGAHQFQLLFQPIVDLSDGRILKAEALLRWLHPTRGLVSPSEFIPIAEDIGIITTVGNWVFQEATRQVAYWRSNYHADFQISVNKSPAQFFNIEHSHRAWLDHLRNLGVSGQCVIVEITEGLLLEANDEVIEQLRDFRAAGIQVALDDFGTGYSALAYLKKFAIDYIKIDRSFISHLSPGCNDLALCEAIIVMAHKLGMKVVAEGIETEEQRRLLTAAGCDFGQGYLFSQPLAVEEFGRFLARHGSTDQTQIWTKPIPPNPV